MLVTNGLYFKSLLFNAIPHNLAGLSERLQGCHGSCLVKGQTNNVLLKKKSCVAQWLNCWTLDRDPLGLFMVEALSKTLQSQDLGLVKPRKYMNMSLVALI